MSWFGGTPESVAKAAKGSSKIGYGKEKQGLYRFTGIVSSRSLAGLRICKVAALQTSPSLMSPLDRKSSVASALTLTG